MTVKVREDSEWSGVITGQARDGHAWQIVKDGTKFARGIHKDFCRPEADETNRPGV